VWDNRPDWLFLGKKVDEETAGGAKPTRAEVIKMKGQTDVPPGEYIETAKALLSDPKAEMSHFEKRNLVHTLIEKLKTLNVPEAKLEVDDTPDWLKLVTSRRKIASADETPAAVPLGQKEEVIETEAQEKLKPVVQELVTTREDEEALKWLESLTTRKVGVQPPTETKSNDSTLNEVRDSVDVKLLSELPPGKRIDIYKNELMRGKELPRFEQFKLAESIIEECRQNGVLIPEALDIALSHLRDMDPADLNKRQLLSQLFLTFIEGAQKLTIPEQITGGKVESLVQTTKAPAAEDDNIPDWLKPLTSSRKIASADETPSASAAEADDELDIAGWLKNRG